MLDTSSKPRIFAPQEDPLIWSTLYRLSIINTTLAMSSEERTEVSSNRLLQVLQKPESDWPWERVGTDDQYGLTRHRSHLKLLHISPSW